MKKILAFEADQTLAHQLAQQFAPYGCTVEAVDDGNVGLQKARNNPPDLILLAIELPKMNGFSICNKLKKNTELKDIPLIILSSEATEDTFQQHRKLRTHAEDYLRKPFDFQELLRKVSSLIELGSEPLDVLPVSGEPEISSVSGEPEISIDTSGLDLMMDEEPNGPFGGVEEDVEAFAESAFAALQVDGQGPGETPVVASEAEGFADFSDNDERTIAGESPFQMVDHRVGAPPAPTEAEVEELDAEILEAEDIGAEVFEDDDGPEPARSALGTLPPGPSMAEPQSQPDATAEPSAGPSPEEERLRAESEALFEAKTALEREVDRLRAQAQKAEDARAAFEVDAVGLRARSAEATAEAERADAETQSLRRDKTILEKQVSQLKEQVEKASEGSGVSSREFLDLRELLNKKDRELLDLKDAINAKEKALLDQREKLTAHARELADRDDKLLALERQVEDQNDKLTATTDDKEMLARKVDGLDKRIESARVELERLRAELDKEQHAHKESRSAAEARRRSELDEQKTRLENEGSLAKEAALSGLRDELEGQRSAEVDALRQEAAAAAASAEQRRERELTEQRLRYDEQLRTTEETLRADKERAVAELAEAHHQTTEQAGKAHAEELVRLREEQAAATAKAAEAREHELSELRKIHQRDMGVLGMKLAETETRLKGSQDLAEERRARIAELEGKVAERGERIGALEGERDGLQRELEAARDTIGARDAEVQALKGRSDLLESRSGHNEERALRALRKVQSDRQVIEKARRAMAIALTFLADLPEHEDMGPPPGSKDGTLRT